MRISQNRFTGVRYLSVIAVSLAAFLILFPRRAHAQEAQPPVPIRAEPFRPRPDESHWELFFNGGVGGTEYSYASSPARHTGVTSYTTEARLTRFINPVVDDGSPRSLQPFLQRASTVSAGFRVAGYGEALTEVSPTGKKLILNQQADINFNPSVDFDVYALRWLAFTGGFEYGHDYLFQPRVTTHRFSPHGGIAARFAETRIDASYSFDAYDTTGVFGGAFLRTGGWGTLSLDIETVILRRIALKLGGKALPHGEGGSGSIEYYFTKNFGVSAGGFGYVGLVDLDSQIRLNNYGLTLGTDLWVGHRARLGLDYQLSGSTAPAQLVPNEPPLPPGNSSISNQVIASALFRLP